MRTSNVGRSGLRPKPAGVYQKTSKEGYAPGLVLYHARELDKARRDITAIRHPNPHYASRSLSVRAISFMATSISMGYTPAMLEARPTRFPPTCSCHCSTNG